MTAILEIKQVGKKGWETNEASRPYLFKNITSAVCSRDRIVLMGKSGQGKSTFLRCLSILDTFDDGSVILDGSSSKQVPPQEWRTSIVYVAQQSTMLPGTIEDNLKTVSRLHNCPFEVEQAKEWLKELGLGELVWDKDASLLSGGEKQRLALVRSLLLKPRILLLDEVTASLDQQSREQVERLLLKLNKEEGVAYIWVTHDWEQAKRISNRVWYMEDGMLMKDTSTDAFFHEMKVTE